MTDMRELEKILEEIDKTIERYGENPYIDEKVTDLCYGMNIAKGIIRKHMNNGWISVDEPPKKDYIAVFAVDKHDYYFVAVYDKEHGYRTNDVGADVDNIVAYCLFNPYRPERSEHDR